MSKVLVLLALSCSGLIAACNADQDHNPLRDYSTAIQNGIPPKADVPPPPQKPVPQDALIIDADEVMVFSEGVERNFDIKLRTFKPDLVTEFEFYGMPDDFKDWKYDVTTSLFTWTPPLDFTGGEFARHFQVVLRFSVPSEGIGTVKTIEMIVYRDETIPEVVAVDWPKGKILQEGGKLPLSVEVLDPDGAGAAPILSVLDKGSKYEKNGAPLVRMIPSTASQPNPQLLSKGLWQYALEVKGEGELTTSKDTYHFALQAISSFGAHSVLSNQFFVVKSKVEPAILSWEKQGRFQPDAIVVQGQNNYLSFTVMAPNNEGRVFLNWETRCDRDLAGSAVCKCQQGSTPSILSCSIDWQVKEMTADVEDFKIRFEVLNRGTEPDNFKSRQEERLVRAIKKEAAQ